MAMMTSHHRLEAYGNGLDQGPQVQPTIIQELVTEDPTVVNPSSSTGLSPPVKQRDRSRRHKDPDRVSVRLNEHLHIHLHNLASSSNMLCSSWRASDSASGQSGYR